MKRDLILGIGSLIMGIFLILNPNRPVKNLNTLLKKELVTYGLIRIVNRVVSVGKEVKTPIFGIPVGAMLDPVDDATERVSVLLTLSLWILGAEKLLFQLFPVGLIVGVGIILIGIWFFLKWGEKLFPTGRFWKKIGKGESTQSFPTQNSFSLWSLRLGLLGVWIPGTILISVKLIEVIRNGFLQKRIDQLTAHLHPYAQIFTDSSLSIIGWIKNLIKSGSTLFSQTAEILVNLGTIYLFQIVIEIGLPILFLYLIVKAIWKLKG